jgi:hypothetical protein
VLGKATAQFNQLKRSTADQHMRSSLRVAASSSNEAPDSLQSAGMAPPRRAPGATAAAAARPAAGTAGSGRLQLGGSRPASAGVSSSTARAPASSSAAAGTAAADQAKFKVPPKRSLAASSQLRLKAPGSAATVAAGARAAAAGPRAPAAGRLGGAPPLTAAARQEARRMASSSGAAAGGGMFSPASPAGGSRLAAADVGSPADDTRSVGYPGRQSLAKGPVNRCAAKHTFCTPCELLNLYVSALTCLMRLRDFQVLCALVFACLKCCCISVDR